jgi:hypothetical protein
MQEARAEAEAGRNALAVPDQPADRLQLPVVSLVARGIGEQGAVVARLQSVEMPPEMAPERARLAPGVQRAGVDRIREQLDPVGLEHRLFLRQATIPLVRRSELPVLTLLASTSG